MSKIELVYHTTNQNDKLIVELANKCKEENKILVLLIPITQEYSTDIIQAYNILNDDLLLYEFSMATRYVLRNRARKYIEYKTNAKLYEVHNN
jgi:hypothetical protein